MSRIFKEEEFAEKRNEILNAALRLVYSKGYEQMSIQDILDELKISKGAFYHYFESKPALLEALIERMGEEIEQAVISVFEDPHLSALAKLQLYFETAVRWKTAQKSLIMALLRVWYTDDNAIVRQKLFSLMKERFSPLLSKVVHQGIRENVFTTRFPDQVGEMITSVAMGLSDGMIKLLLTSDPNLETLRSLELYTAAYIDTMERILGAPQGSMSAMVDIKMLKEWIVLPDDMPGGDAEQSQERLVPSKEQI